MERFEKNIDEGLSIEYSEINILCSKLREIDACIKLFYKTNSESSIDKSNKFMFYQLIEPITDQIISFYDLIRKDRVSITPEGPEYTEGNEKTETECLQKKIKEELEQLSKAQERYAIQ